MAITLQQLAYFMSAVKHGSLSAAAEANFVAQPSVSEQIKRLEQQLGVTLFVRTNRKLILTESARMLIPYAQRTLDAAAELSEAVNPIRTMTGGTVAFGTFSSAHHLLHEDVVADFRALHPLVRLRLIGLNSSDVADALREGELEAGLVALPVDDHGLDVSRVLWTSEAVYLSSVEDRVQTPVTPEMLAERELVLPEVRWGDTDPTRRQLVARMQVAGVRLDPVVEVESPAAALALCARGVGDTIISLPLAHKLGHLDRLHWVSLDPPLYETFAFVTRQGGSLSPATNVLLRLVAARLARLPHATPVSDQ